MFGGSTRMIKAEGTFMISAMRSTISCHFSTMPEGTWMLCGMGCPATLYIKVPRPPKERQPCLLSRVREADGFLRPVPEADRLRVHFVDAPRGIRRNDGAVGRAGIVHHRRRALLQLLLRLHRHVEPAHFPVAAHVVEDHLARLANPVRFDQLPQPPRA